MFFILTCTLWCFAQGEAGQLANPQIVSDTTYNPDDDIFAVVESMPEFIGGDVARAKYLSENIIYPESARINGIEGKVFITFIVEKSGRLSNIKVMRRIPSVLDEEAIRVIKSMPKWKAGRIRGKPVRVSLVVPVSFVLNPEKKAKE